MCHPCDSPARCSGPGKKGQQDALCFSCSSLGCSSNGFSSPISPTGPGQEVVAGGGGPQGTMLCSGEGCWHPPSLLDAGISWFPITDCQGKVKVQLNSAYPVPSSVSENTRCALKQGLHLHHVHGIFKQPSKTRRSGEAGHAGLQVCLSQTDPCACPKCDPVQRALPKARRHPAALPCARSGCKALAGRA